MADIQEVIEIVTRGNRRLDRLIEQNEQLADSANRAGESTNRSSDALGGLKKAAGAYLTLAFGKKIAEEAIELGTFGAQVLIVRKNFDNFATGFGKNAESMRVDLRKASQGMINDVELQQLAMQSMVSGVDYQDLLVAMEFVSKQATATGANVSQKMQTVMTGFARGSAQFLDDVGIQVMGAEDVVGAAVAQMKEKMGVFADATEEPIGKIEAFRVGIENFRAELGTKLTPVLEAGIELINDFKDSFTPGQIENFGSTIKHVFTGVLFAAEWLGSGVNTIVSYVDIQINAMIDGAFRAVEGVTKFLKEQAQAWATLVSAGPLANVKALRMWSRNIQSLGGDLQEFETLMDDMGNSSAKRTKESIESWNKRQQALKKFREELMGLRNEQKAAKPELEPVDFDFGGDDDNGDKEAKKRIDERKKRQQEFSYFMLERMIERRDWEKELAEEAAQHRLDMEQKVKDSAFELGNQLMSLTSTIFSKKMESVDIEAREKKELAQNTIKDQRRLDAELAKIDAEAEERRKKLAIADYVARVSGATGDLAASVLNTIKDQPGGAISKVAGGLSIAGFGASYLATVIGSAPKFFNGGTVPNNGNNRDSQIIVARSGEEILNPVEGRRYRAGVTNNTNNRNNNYNINVTVTGGSADAQELTAQLTSVLPAAIERAGQTGSIDWNRAGVATA